MLSKEGFHHVQAQSLFKLQAIELSNETIDVEALDGIGMLLQLGQLQTLNLEGAELRAAGARRLSLELGSAPHLTELKCVTSELTY